MFQKMALSSARKQLQQKNEFKVSNLSAYSNMHFLSKKDINPLLGIRLVDDRSQPAVQCPNKRNVLNKDFQRIDNSITNICAVKYINKGI